MMALGLIETKGLLAAVEAADAMLKTAEVRLLERSLVGGGLVTMTIGGEVSAVQASIDAAVTAIQRIPGAELLSAHVIARPDDELTHILLLEPDPVPETALVSASVLPTPPTNCAEKDTSSRRTAVEPETEAGAPVSEAIPVAIERPVTAGTSAEVAAPVSAEAEAPAASAVYSTARLKALSLNKLRELALQFSEFPLSGEQIATADKKSLIAEILRISKRDAHK